MKKYLSLLVLLFAYTCFAENAGKTVFLENYFGNKNFQIQKYSFSEFDFYFAYNEIEGVPTVFSKGIMFLEKEDGFIKPIGYFLNEIIYNSEGIIFSGTIKTQTFSGWSVKVIEKNSGFSTVFYTNDGKNKTEGPILVWNKNKLEKFIIDKSMW
ncbi:hypothetical protein V1L52_12580 [Treponema sp. HNW]|uniref:hypothetical protein n=1 Tax=Treponema sp. HNW TaxID=3116654 RepID=UPI003D109891